MSNETRREVAVLYFVSTVEEMGPLGEPFHHGFSWGIHEAANRAVGLSTRKLADVRALALAWGEENCPAVDEGSYEERHSACLRCPGHCRAAAQRITSEVVD